ncbi:MAG: isochorismate synthase [Phototrophicales bacterium]|nr:MAG: isochorismate synthase [Phototrophicales bacterium]
MMSGHVLSVMHPIKSVGAQSASVPILIAAARPIPHIDLLHVLRAAPQATQRIFWQHADQPVAFAGWGIAAEIVAYGRERFKSIQQQVDALFENAIFSDVPRDAQPRLIGGFAFRDDFSAASGVWSAFPSAYFVLPRVQVTQANGETWLTVSAYLDQAVDPDSAWERLYLDIDTLESQLHSSIPWSIPEPRAIQLEDSLPYPVWREQVLEATRRIRAGELEKVVLSRFKDVLFDAPIDPARALEQLTQSYPQAYRFLIEVFPGHAFFGATPELLVSKDGTQICTAALAGSRPRGGTAAEDKALAADMFASHKERAEHQVVVEAIEALLSPFVERIYRADQPDVMRLRNIQHLYTPMTGTLLPNVSLLEVTGAFHPTPALGGYPRNVAVETIRRIETDDRGWYAAPIGWIDANGDGIFAVAIRSAVSVEDHARLYAGAGIVADSDPDKEWDETALKFKPLMSALEIEDRVRAES